MDGRTAYDRIAVFGGGNGGLALAGLLSLAGHDVTLSDHPAFFERLRPAQSQGIDVIADAGPLSGHAELEVTDDLRSWATDADLIAVTTQAYGHAPLARELATVLDDGQHVILLPGSSLGALEFFQAFRQAGGITEPVIAESNTLVFAARRTENPSEVRIKHWASEVFVAALSPASTGDVLEPLGELYPQCRAATDVLELALLNLNPYVHSAAAVLSIAGVEGAGGQWRHYVDGITPSTAMVMRDLDSERINVCEALGYRTAPIEQLFHSAGYSASASGDLLADMTSTPVLREARGPFDIGYRYYTEDTGVGLTVTCLLGEQLGIPMPTHRSLVHLCGIMTGVDYFAACTRSPERLGIGDLDGPGLREFFSVPSHPNLV